MDLQMTAAVPGLKPLLQIASHTPPMLISGRPWPSMDGEPSSKIKRTAPCDASASSDAVQYTTVSKACPAHISSGGPHALFHNPLGTGARQICHGLQSEGHEGHEDRARRAR